MLLLLKVHWTISITDSDKSLWQPGQYTEETRGMLLREKTLEEVMLIWNTWMVHRIQNKPCNNPEVWNGEFSNIDRCRWFFHDSNTWMVCFHEFWYLELKVIFLFQVWDWLFKSCEVNGRILFRDSLISFGEVEEFILKGNCKKLSIKLPAWSMLQCLLTSAKSNSDGLVICTPLTHWHLCSMMYLYNICIGYIAIQFQKYITYSIQYV